MTNPTNSKFKPIAPYQAPPSELSDFVRTGVAAPPAVEIVGGRVTIKRQPNRPNHLCVGCLNCLEYVRKRDPGPRPTGVVNAEWMPFCTAGPELIDLSEETVFDCNRYRSRKLRRFLLAAAIAVLAAVGTFTALKYTPRSVPAERTTP